MTGEIRSKFVGVFGQKETGVDKDRGWLYKLKKKIVEYVKNKYIQKIENYLNANDFSNKKDDVINYCIENTKALT